MDGRRPYPIFPSGLFGRLEVGAPPMNLGVPMPRAADRRSRRHFSHQVALVLTVYLVSRAAAAAPNLSEGAIAPTRDEFEFARTGGGNAGRWAIVRDTTANDGVAIEQVSTDFTEGRFPLAIYNPLSLKNLRMSARVKSIAGTMQSAGLAIRIADANNYYVVRASALETRVDLFRVLDGRMERIAGTDADVQHDHWQTLGVSVENDSFTVSINGKLLFTAWDRSLTDDGRVGLWTEEDNVTRFADLKIEALPWSEEP